MIFKTNNHFKQSYYFLESSRGTLQTFRVRNHKGKTQLAAATIHQFRDCIFLCINLRFKQTICKLDLVALAIKGPLKTPAPEWCLLNKCSTR